MIYSGRRHSAATSSYRPSPAENNAESEASRRVSVGANLDQQYRAMNAPLSSKAKSKWSSDNCVKPAFIVNNPATWRTQTNQEEEDKSWQSKLVRKRRTGIPSQLSPHEEVKETENESSKNTSKLVIQPSEEIKEVENTTSYNNNSKLVIQPVTSLNQEQSQPVFELDPYETVREDWRLESLNPVQAKSWNRLYSGEDDFKAWKAQVMSEIKQSKASLDKRFEQIEAANKKAAAVKKKVRIAKPEPITEAQDDEVLTKANAESAIAITKPLEDLRVNDDKDDDDDDVKQVIPKWKKKNVK